jgi:hypothetical protein
MIMKYCHSYILHAPMIIMYLFDSERQYGRGNYYSDSSFN